MLTLLVLLAFSLEENLLLDVETTLEIWLDGQHEPSIQTDGNALVSRWTNRSTNNDAIQQTANQQPEYQTEQQMLNFNGEQYLVVDNQIVDTSSTYFVVYQGNDPVGTLFAKAETQGEWSRGGKTFFIRNSKFSTDVGWVGYVESPTPVSTGQPVIAMFEHVENGNSDRHRIYQNGMQVVESYWNFNTFPESDFNDGIFKIGYTSTNFPQSHGLYGKIGELIKIDQAISDQQRFLIHAYLAQKWSIQSTVDSDEDGVFDNMDNTPFTPNE